MRKKGIRIRIGFTKKDGKVAEFWTSAPETWDTMGDGNRDAWVFRAASKYHGGATNAKCLERE